MTSLFYSWPQRNVFQHDTNTCYANYGVLGMSFNKLRIFPFIFSFLRDYHEQVLRITRNFLLQLRWLLFSPSTWYCADLYWWLYIALLSHDVTFGKYYLVWFGNILCLIFCVVVWTFILTFLLHFYNKIILTFVKRIGKYSLFFCFLKELLRDCVLSSLRAGKILRVKPSGLVLFVQESL